MAKNHSIGTGTPATDTFSANEITTILFDLDGTLRHTVPNGQDVLVEYAVTLGAPANPDLRRLAMKWSHQYWAVSECLLNDLKIYGRENQEFWQNYARRQLEAIRVPPQQAEEWAPLIHSHMLDNYQPEDVILEDVLPTLQSLRQAGYTLGLVTNRHSPVDEYLEHLGLDSYLNFWVVAGEIGAWKPQPEIFQYALGQANASPDQVVYVGDNYYSDVLGAQKADIQPLLLDPTGIFPEADCIVIQSIAELISILPEKAD